MKRALLLVFFVSATAFAQIKDSSWDAGRVEKYDPASNNGIHRASLQVVNRCCKGEHMFTVGSVSPWVVISPGDAQFTLADGAIRTVYVGLDARGLRIGTHEATIFVRCLDCEGDLCSYRVNTRLEVTQKITTGVYVSTQPRVDCPDPPFRVKAGATARHCTFTGSYGPQIQVTSCAGRGEGTPEGLKTLLGDMAKTISAVSNAKSAFDLSGTMRQPQRVSGATAAGGATTAGGGKTTEKATGHEIDIPTSAVEVPTALASNMLNAGQKVVDWAVRAGNREGRMCLALSATVEEVATEYDCLPFEVCEQGFWRDDGPHSVPDKLPQPLPVVKQHERAAQEFFVINNNMTEFQQAVGQLQTWLSQIGIAEKMERMKIFETLGPCHACDPPAALGPGGPVAGAPSGGGGRSCQHILREIGLLENEIFQLQAETDELRRQLQSMPNKLQQLDSRCQQESAKLEGELDTARRGVIRAPSDKAALDAATARRDAAQDALNKQRQQCNQQREQLERERQRLENTIRESEASIARMQGRLAELRKEYKECLGQ